jgi:hypothetical protein
MGGLARQDVGAVEVLTTQLRRLDDAVHGVEEHDDYQRTSLAPVGIRPTTPPPALVVDEDEEELPQVQSGIVPADMEAAGTDDERARPSPPMGAVAESRPVGTDDDVSDPPEVSPDERRAAPG